MRQEELGAEGHTCSDNCSWLYDERRTGQREMPDGSWEIYTYMVSIYRCNVCYAEFEM